jgi:UDP-4-amino-4-deoxy-L-arabinose-oxoglutarate aminotransferase
MLTHGVKGVKKTLHIKHSRPWITGEDRARVNEVIQSGMLARGTLSSTFEKEVASYNECKGGIGFPSGTSALAFALKCLGAGAASEIILPTYVCSSVLHAVQSVGSKPILCDIGENTWNMTPESVRPLLSRKTAAIIVVHIFGIPADVRGIMEFGIPIIEDCAQAFGAESKSKKVGSIGTLGVYSFHATKCLTTGEGGMVVTREDAILDRMKKTREAIGENMYPLSDMQAALGLSQLRRYNAFLKKRSALASIYFDGLPNDLTKRLFRQDDGEIFFRFPLYGELDFETLRKNMGQYDIQIRKGVDLLIHRNLGLEDEQFPHAVEAFKKTICLPLHPSMDEQDVRYVSTTLRAALL